MQVLPDDVRDQWIVAARLEHREENRKGVEPFELWRGDDDLQQNVRRPVGGVGSDQMIQRRTIANRPNGPGPDRRVAVAEQLSQDVGTELTDLFAADQCPEGVQASAVRWRRVVAR